MTDKELSISEKKQLLEIARQTIERHFQRAQKQSVEPTTPFLARHCGAFVTLHKHEALRGCIGTFVGTKPLVQIVQDMAISAAFHDPRFLPLQENELQEVDIELSVLSPLRKVENVSEIKVGRDGIFIRRDFYSGVLLPQVATEYGWDRNTFLTQTCLKAGLEPNAWKDPQTRIEVFEAQVFGEKKTFI